MYLQLSFDLLPAFSAWRSFVSLCKTMAISKGQPQLSAP